MSPRSPSFFDSELAVLGSLAQQFPTVDAAVAEIARLAGELTRPKGTVHIISDIHGEFAKLRHVINNASGTLRPLVEKVFAERLPAAEMRELTTLLFYPKETPEALDPTLADSGQRQEFCRRILGRLFEIVHVLAGRVSLQELARIVPVEYRDLFLEIYSLPDGEGTEAFLTAAVETLVQQGRAWQLIRLTVRLVRNLAVSELVIGGDCWDRGPRGDKVVDYLRQQPNVTVTWGNHDVSWFGACLGNEALIAHVLRISMRYRRLFQLEEGYGITLLPLDNLARTVYQDDPAATFTPKVKGLRDATHVARMQKAAAIMQFKLEGQAIARHPEWAMDHRRLMDQVDLAKGVVTIDGVPRELKDARLPTLDPANPYALSPEERVCMDRLKQSFLASQTLWEHVRYLITRGSLWLMRDDHLIFHGCVPVDKRGEFLALEVDGRNYRGQDLFEALERVVVRALDEQRPRDLDMLWYLWCGPLSPLFGKDRIATFEIDLVKDPATHVETKNPYFQLLNDPAFCDSILGEFGVDPQRGLIVNGHVPVKIDKGESPLKKSGKAITIDGAFSEAYGDHGYTLVLEPERTYLATHHHFESVEAAVRDGVDIVPEVTEVRRWDRPRRVADTEQGAAIHARMQLLQRLVAAYRDNRLRQRTT